MPMWGGIEAGGTKFVCAIGTGPDDLRAETTIPTTEPGETIGRAIDFFRREADALEAIGIGSFGPVDLHPSSPTFGHITNTPKPVWAGSDIVNPIRQALGVPVAIDTDVNAAALGEHRWGAAQGLNTFIYLTVGTGIGGGGMVGAQLLHGMTHPEMGHMGIPHDWERDPFPGSCAFHGDCLEGLASGLALEARWGQRGEILPDDHPAWILEAEYLAWGAANLTYILSPQRIVMGGGVMQRRQLFPLVRQRVIELINDYLPSLADQEGYIVPPGLGNRSGVLGAIALAQGVESGTHP